MPTLADQWKDLLAKAPVSPADEAPTEEDRRVAAEIIEKIRAEVPKAAAARKNSFLVGNFRRGDLLRKMPNEGLEGQYWPSPGDLKGAAKLVHEFCIKEGLALHVGGEYKGATKTHVDPFEITVHLSRTSD